MEAKINLEQHLDPWVNLPSGYVGHVMKGLATGGLSIQASWMDPRDPRDSTIVYADDTARTSTGALRALVWDEETGWRDGVFVSGEQGVRTKLTDVTYLGGGLLVDGAELARRKHDDVRVARPVYRSRHDLRDGLDDTLRTY